MEFLLRPPLYERNGGLRMAISDDARKCVVFFGKQVPPKAGAPSTESSEIQYGGTGFIVAHVDDGQPFHYLVTCRHVAAHLDIDFFLRLNTLAGAAEPKPIASADWLYHPDDAVDIAITAIGMDATHFDHRALPLTKVASKDKTFCGQRVHIVGLFRLHYGKMRNVPIVHTGHIAALADPKEKIVIVNCVTSKQVMAESYLVEVQTLEGLSGSPVFVQEYFPWIAQIESESGDVADETVAAFGPMVLLGVYQGAWDAVPGAILAADRNIEGTLRIPLGMGMVVPIEQVWNWWRAVS